MLWQPLRLPLLVGAIAVAAPALHAADSAHPGPAPCPPPPMQTICVKEWVPEQYQTTRTTYRTEYRNEKYTAFKCEQVPEQRTRVVTVCKSVPTVETRTRTFCVEVPCVETRTVMQKHVTCKPVTTIERKKVDRGHYECREVPCSPSLRDRLAKWRKKDCCEPECPPPTKTVKVWVPCIVCEEYPVTKMQRVCEYVPVTKQVTVCKKEYRQEQYQVTVCKMVPETKTETYTCLVSRNVPYEATRCVAVCVPHTENVTCTRLVCRTVEKQVPVTDCCDSTANRCAKLVSRYRDCCK